MIKRFIKQTFSSHKYLNLRKQSSNIHGINRKLLNILNSETNEGIRITIAEIFKISQKISQLQTQLNNQPELEQLYLDLKEKGYSIYLEGLNMHVSKPFKYYNKNFTLQLLFKAQQFQVRNDPLTRQSLYFQQLKDLDKYIDINREPNIPEKIKQIQRIFVEDQVIDRENPLGFPEIEPQKIKLKLINGQRYIKGDLSYNLGKIRLLSLTPSQLVSQSKPSKKAINLYGKSDEVNRHLKDFIEEMVPAQDIGELISLSNIMTQVSEIEQLKNLHKFISSDLLQQQEENE